MKINKRMLKRQLKFTFNGEPVKVMAHVSASRNLFFAGTIGSDSVAGFIWRQGGGHYFESDALGKRDEYGFYQELVRVAGPVQAVRNNSEGRHYEFLFNGVHAYLPGGAEAFTLDYLCEMFKFRNSGKPVGVPV